MEEDCVDDPNDPNYISDKVIIGVCDCDCYDLGCCFCSVIERSSNDFRMTRNSPQEQMSSLRISRRRLQ